MESLEVAKKIVEIIQDRPGDSHLFDHFIVRNWELSIDKPFAVGLPVKGHRQKIQIDIEIESLQVED